MHPIAWSVLVWTLAFAAGPDRPGAPACAAGPVPGVVFVAGGIGGLDPLQAAAPWSFSRAGVPHEVRVFEWTHGKGRLLRDLQDSCHLCEQAERLACAVRTVLAETPGRPVYLVGHSAGGGLVLMAAAKLPPDTLERVVVLSAAISPTYDLRPALRAARGGVVSFNSTLDRFYLDWGTRQFGTVDRIYGPAAGLDGFQIPANLSKEDCRLYERLVQVPWRLGMVLEFRGGWHHSTTMPLFLAREVAPWLLP